MATNSAIEKAREELKAQREEAMRRNAVVGKRTKGKRTDCIKDIGRDFEAGKDYYVALLSLVPMIGAAHWFHAKDDVKEDGTPYTGQRNCSANLLVDDSYGKNPVVCPACYLAGEVSEYYNQNGELPTGKIPIDLYQGKPNGPTLLIYYYAIVGEPKEVIVEKADGTESKRIRIEWWKNEDTNDYTPIVLKVKPSVNTMFSQQLNNIDAFEGDIRAYLWKIHKAATNSFDKYAKCGPLLQKGSLAKVPDWVVERRDDFIATLPPASELLAPTPPFEMAELLEIKSWGKATKKEKVADAVEEADLDVDMEVSAPFDVDNAGEDEVALDLDDLESLN